MTEVTSIAAICDIRFAIAVASPACALRTKRPYRFYFTPALGV